MKTNLEKKLAIDFYKRALNDAPSGLVIIGPEGKIVHFNLEGQNLFGYTNEEVVGKPIEMLIPERFRENHPEKRTSFFNNPVKRIMGAGRELFALKKDGTEFPIEIGLAPFKTKDESYSIAMVIDITEKRFAENKEREQAQKVRALYTELSTVSSPILEVWDGVMILPLIGTLDSRRAQNAIEKALVTMSTQKMVVLIIDITGVLVVDTLVADSLLRIASAVRLMGGTAILTGISPDAAHTIVKLGVDLTDVETRGSLSQGLKYAISLLSTGGKK